MKTRFLTALFALGIFTLSHAQDTPAVDIAARRKSVADLKKHVAAREDRFKEIVSDIRSLDDRNEKRIGALVESLKDLKDSEATGTRVNELKTRVIEGLGKSIRVYQGKRREIFERLRSGKSAQAEALSGDLEKLDARTQKRVDQIMELAKSMPPRRNDVEKYEPDGTFYWNGWFQENTRISDEWKQNRRQGVATDKEVREVRDALGKAIDILEAREASISNLLKERKLADAEREIQEQELGRINAQLEHRHDELADLNSTDSAGATEGAAAASKDQAEEIKDMIEDSRKDIAEDFWTVIRKFGEAAAERDKIISLQENLAAREKWLAEDAPAGP